MRWAWEGPAVRRDVVQDGERINLLCPRGGGVSRAEPKGQDCLVSPHPWVGWERCPCWDARGNGVVLGRTVSGTCREVGGCSLGAAFRGKERGEGAGGSRREGTLSGLLGPWGGQSSPAEKDGVRSICTHSTGRAGSHPRGADGRRDSEVVVLCLPLGCAWCWRAGPHA